MISSLQIQWFALRWMWVRHNCGEWEDCRVDTYNTVHKGIRLHRAEQNDDDNDE